MEEAIHQDCIISQEQMVMSSSDYLGILVMLMGGKVDV